MRVAIYVQHLLGTGHLVRMQALAKALHESGHETMLVSGGKVVSQGLYQITQLPVLKTLPGDFLTLLDENLTAVSDTWKASRANQLEEAIIGFVPDMVVIETWPFGRRQMQFEVLPLVRRLGALTRPPMLVSSIRDVLQRRKLKRREQTLEEVAEFIDLVLVHGEEELTPLAESFEEAALLRSSIAYSGYIANAGLSDGKSGGDATHSGEIVVSAGGGATGIILMQAAAKAASLDHRHWRLLVGPNVEDTVFDDLQAKQNGNLIVERNRSDFRDLLARCSVSVSQFGYNTALDLIVAGCPAVVVPYAEDGETEQTQRAKCFEEKGYVVSLDQENLTPATLLGALEKARINSATDCSNRDLNGASRSVQILESHYEKFRSQPA